MDGVIAAAQVMGWIFETTISTPTNMYGFLGQKGLLARYRQFFLYGVQCTLKPNP
jgi:hypothetical protein